MPEYIVEVSEADFAYQVLARSQQVPVVVDFWAPWCGPCHMLGPILEKLAHEAEGAFVLAKVNVDENPRLAAQYGVRGIPAVKVFINGRVAGGFVGAQPEERVRAFLRQFAPSQADLALEKGHNLLAAGDLSGAEEAFRTVLAERPEDPYARLGLAKALLRQGRAAEALPLLERFPASKVYDEAQRLLPLARALLTAQQAPESSDDPLEAMYFRALRLVAAGNLPAAMDGLLEVLRRDKGYRDGEAHQVALGVLALMGEGTAEAKQYRQELAMILF